MSLNTIVYELLRFLKDNIIKIALSAFVFSLVLTGGKYYLATRQRTEDNLIAAYDALSVIYEQEPAEFKFVVQNPDGTLFDNSFIIDEYLAQSSAVEEIERMTHVPIKEVLEYEKELGLYKTSKFRGGLAVIRDTSTNSMTTRVQIGKNKEDNLAVARGIQQLIESGSIPFLEDKEVVFFQQASIGETIDPEANILADPLSELKAPKVAGGIGSFSQTIILGLIAGFIVIAGLLFIARLLSQRIRYAFEYSWELNDQHLLYQPQKYVNFTLDELIHLPVVAHRLILDERGDRKSGDWLSGLEDITPDHSAVDEIVFIIRQGETTKSWYDGQYSIAKLYRCPLRIIHVVE